jgi:hypothetical protein
MYHAATQNPGARNRRGFVASGTTGIPGSCWATKTLYLSRSSTMLSLMKCMHAREK